MKLKKNWLIIAVLGIVASCHTDNHLQQPNQKLSTKSTSIFQTEDIGYYNENESFVSIDELDFTNYLNNLLAPDAPYEFQSYSLVSSGSGDDAEYHIRAKGTGISVITEISYEPTWDHYVLVGGKTCSCSTTDCASTGGCDAEIVDGDCNCSPCSLGGCTKSSTISTGISSQDFSGAFW